MNFDLQNLAVSYMDSLLEELLKPFIFNNSFATTITALPSEIFKILSSREFTYFTRIKAEPYRIIINRKIQDSYSDRKQLVFYYNLGGGYHARISEGLSFEPGLSELMTIFQIRKILGKLEIYPFGVRFEIIIDNRCAELANHILIKDTSHYSNELGAIIKKLGLSPLIKIVLESDLVSKEDFNNQVVSCEKDFTYKISDKDCKNACRFCKNISTSNQITCAKRYKIINNVSRDISSEYAKDGVHLTQRSTDKSFPFRSFPGGDSKIQCGKVVLLLEGKTIKKPLLITANNIGKYDLFKINLPDRFPIPDILIARNKN
ncbi:hypothetical protein A2609_00100 [Candidatus Kaiserbacteria bacterium RIFOXYD1_FULL_47_14]|uniref:Uncharacterized protein n=1 Tax=Candidatus Kaiserbacteria bacterium RIFOXYD1_FULL_47_14 TaxID=1798533 RepID=A0A1F6G7V0_9BACT|nr:MAG: hypothetical protein A2609_00100 [Candidatus Kaiserbacteria bacterium RIFOXYD1_FULL_47_14]